MPSTRRKSVAFRDVDPIAQEASAGPTPAVRSTRSGSTRVGAVESDGGFKFKRRKVAATAEELPAKAAQASATAHLMANEQTDVPMTVNDAEPHNSEAANSLSIAASSRENERKKTVAAPPPKPQAPSISHVVPTPGVSVPQQPAITTPAAVVAPPPPPSLLSRVSPEILHALHEVCTACRDDDASISLPTMSLALAACTGELSKLGVTSAPPANLSAAKLCEQEEQLAARVAELEATVRQWDEAAALASAPPAKKTIDGVGPSASVLSLPEPPQLRVELAELGVLSSLCAEQVEAVSRQLVEATRAKEREHQHLTKAAHHALNDYGKAKDTKELLRDMLAI